MSRLEQLPNGHSAERYDHTPRNCSGCGKPLSSPNVSLGTSTCRFHGRTRDHTCRSCRTVHVDCACTDVDALDDGSAYFRRSTRPARADGQLREGLGLTTGLAYSHTP